MNIILPPGRLVRTDFNVVGAVDSDPGTNTVDSAVSTAGQLAATLSGRTAATSFAGCAAWLWPLKDLVGASLVNPLKPFDLSQLLCKLVGAPTADAIVGVALVDSATVAGISTGVGVAGRADGAGWEVSDQRWSGGWTTFIWSGTPSAGGEYLGAGYSARGDANAHTSMRGNVAFLWDEGGNTVLEQEGGIAAQGIVDLTHLAVFVGSNTTNAAALVIPAIEPRWAGCTIEGLKAGGVV